MPLLRFLRCCTGQTPAAARRALSLALLWGLSACGGGSGAPPAPLPTVAPRIDSFQASSTAVARGGEVTLSWSTSGADVVDLEPLAQGLPPDGERRVRVQDSSFYTLSARNAIGTTTQNLNVAAVDYDWTALQAELDSLIPEAVVDAYVFELRVDDVTVFRSNGGDLQPDSAVFVASASKALASAALLTLVRDGLLDLDKPVATYLEPEIDWPPLKSAITTRMLLNHTSGLATDIDCISDPASDLRECVQSIADAPLQSVPGNAFAYGGNSYQVAGLIAEILSGQSFNTFFIERLADPLDMPQTRFFGTNPRVAGGATTSAPDYLRFMQMLLSEGRVGDEPFLPQALAREVRSSQIQGRPRRQLPPGASAFFDGYALGWWHTRSNALQGLSDGPEISDPGLFGTVPWMDFDRRYAAILLLRSEGVVVGVQIWDDLRPLILAQLAGQS